MLGLLLVRMGSWICWGSRAGVGGLPVVVVVEEEEEGRCLGSLWGEAEGAERERLPWCLGEAEGGRRVGEAVGWWVVGGSGDRFGGRGMSGLRGRAGWRSETSADGYSSNVRVNRSAIEKSRAMRTRCRSVDDQFGPAAEPDYGCGCRRRLCVGAESDCDCGCGYTRLFCARDGLGFVV